MNKISPERLKEFEEVDRKYRYELTMARIFGPCWWDRFPVLIKIQRLLIRFKLWRMEMDVRVRLLLADLQNGLGNTDAAFVMAAVMITLMLWFAFLAR